MKRKRLFITASLSILLGLGVAAGTSTFSHTKPVEKVEAARASTIYCKMTASWWTKDGAAIGAYYWKSTDTNQNNTWPGSRMTGTGVANEWKITIPSGYDRVIFTRINSSGTVADWGAKTKDQTLLTDGTNYCTINTAEVWGSPGCEATWSVKKDLTPSTSKNQFYVFDPHGILGNTFSNVKVYAFNDNQKNLIKDEWPGTHNGITQTTLGITPVYSVSISTSFTSFIMNGNNDQTVDVSITGNTGNVLVIEEGQDGEGHNYIHWSNASDYNGDYPASTGYYIYGSKTSWTFTGATKMSAGTGGDVAQLLNYSGKSGEKIKVRGYYTDREDPNIYSYYDGGNQPFGGGDGDANFVFSADMVVDIFAKYVSDELKFYVNEHYETEGYIMTGDAAFVSATGKSGLAWSFAAGTKMDTPSAGTNLGSAVLNVNSTVLFRVRKHISGNINWLNFPVAYDGTDGITRTAEGNVQLLAGIYTVYVNNQENVYVMKGIPLDAFCSDFLTQINNVCKKDGSTSLSQLRSVWSDLAGLYASVISEGKTTIYNIGFNGGSETGDDPHKVVAAYHYIVTKYGTANCNDFIWNQNVTGTYRARISILSNATESTSTALIIIIVSSISVLSVGGYFFLRKKKENK